MSVPLAYWGVVIIWSTTPLAIKWSGEGVGFLFGLTGRMVLGLAVCTSVLLLLRQRLPLNARALKTYLVAGGGAFGAMLLVYWGAQFIPSGLISVLFGLSPIITGVLAAALLKEDTLRPHRIIGVIIGIAGLIVIFGLGNGNREHMLWGVAALVFAVTLHSGSIVWIKHINAPLHPLASATGALTVATPLYIVLWLALDGQWPNSIPLAAGASIAYLALAGSVLGAVLFFYALKHLSASRLALIPLITPVNALLLGAGINGETISVFTLIGATLILLGLVFHELPGPLRRAITYRRKIHALKE